MLEKDNFPPECYICGGWTASDDYGQFKARADGEYYHDQCWIEHQTYLKWSPTYAQREADARGTKNSG